MLWLLVIALAGNHAVGVLEWIETLDSIIEKLDMLV